MNLLRAVSEHGSISAAARSLSLSYRHVWGELKRWEDLLGQELIVWGKGQSAQLSEFGTKLMWAERQTQARLAPQIEALRADLQRTLAVAFDPHAHVLTLYASHDDALPRLREFAARDGLHLDVRFCGSVDAIRALNEGRCTMAGFHTLAQPDDGSTTAHAYRHLLEPGRHKILGFAARTQGLIVPAGNPAQLQSLADVIRQSLRFARRDLGSGTRVLLEDLLAQSRLNASALRCTADEPSHAAVAEAVASGQADVGLGLQSAAVSRGLGFVPLVQEVFYLVCLKSSLDTPATLALQAVLKQPQWHDALNALPGYAPWQCGLVQSLRSALPWWTYKRHKRPHQA
ncbi:MAG: hypothetical protein RLZZ24_447 [Pseudomonadota bacterium]